MPETMEPPQRLGPADQKTVEQNRQDIVTRWGGHSVLIQNGFTPVVTAFLWYAAHLEPEGLTPAEVVFVLQLMAYKRDAADPYPSYQRLAGRMGVSVPYARKIAQTLEKRGLLRRLKRSGESNRFDLQPLFDELAKHVKAHRAAALRSAAEVNLP